MSNLSTPSTILFLCSGNYYRSRFAEILFNALAEQSGLPWRAVSAGLIVDRPNNNVGPISMQTVAALRARNIRVTGEKRSPRQVTGSDLAAADWIVAVKEAEHRPLLRERFTDWEDCVEYWHVHDLDKATAEEALTEIEARMKELLIRISAQL